MQKCNDDNIPLADDDPQVIITDDVENNRLDHGRSMDSLPSSYTGGSSSPGLNGPPSFEPDSGIDEQEEKARLISQVLELQNTLDGKFNALVKIRNAQFLRRNFFIKNVIVYSIFFYQLCLEKWIENSYPSA